MNQNEFDKEYRGCAAKIFGAGCVGIVLWLAFVAVVLAGGIWLVITVLRALGIAI